MTDQNKDKNQKPGTTKQSQDDKQKKPAQQQQAGATKPDAARKPSQKR